MKLTFSSQGTAITSGNTGNIIVSSASDHFRLVVRGAGTASVVPQINSSTDHATYTVSDETILLDLSGVEQFDVTASGGDIEVDLFGYSS